MMRIFHTRLSGPRIVALLPRWLIILSSCSIAGIILLGMLVKIDLTVSLDGKTRPENFTEVRVGREGTIAAIYVKEGAFVDSGTLLGEMYNNVERDAVVMAERRLAAAEAEVKRVEAELQLTSVRYRTGVSEARAFVEEMMADQTSVQVGIHPEEIRKAEESLEQARITLHDAEEELRRGEILIKANAITPNEFERRRSSAALARHSFVSAEATLARLRTYNRPHDFAKSDARLAAARAQEGTAMAAHHAIDLKRAELLAMQEEAEAARAALSISQTNLERTFLRAPVAGYVLTGDLEQLIGRGLFAGAVAISIGDPDTVVIRARIPESKSGDLATGMRVKVFLAAFPHTRYRVFEGKLTMITPMFQTIDWEALGIPREEVTPEMRESFTHATILLSDPFVFEHGERQIISPGLSSRCDVILDEGPALFVALQYLRKGYRNIPNINFHL